MERRGQVFLIAAIIVVGALVSISSIFNAARARSSNEQFYDLSREIKFETKRVLDYGIYYRADTDTLVKQFLEEYASYIAQQKVLFLVGNESGLFGLYFQNNALSGSVNIVTGQTTVVPIQVVRQEEARVTPNQQTGEVSVAIDGAEYVFKLLSGENFFFVIIKEENDEAFVAAG